MMVECVLEGPLCYTKSTVADIGNFPHPATRDSQPPTNHASAEAEE